jgi:hypothetical protein
MTGNQKGIAKLRAELARADLSLPDLILSGKRESRPWGSGAVPPSQGP